MVIQRWQSLMLLLAVIFVAVFSLTPYATYSTEAGLTPVYVSEAPVLLTITILVGLLLFVSIFMFKNLKRQMTVTLISIVLLIATIVTGIFVVLNAYPGAEFIVFGGVVLLIVATILAIAAYRFMLKDQRLLRSYDRLR